MRRLFVLGSPRSGTTVVGRFLASHPACLDLGEFYGFFQSAYNAPASMQRMPTPFKDAYLEHIFLATQAFADNEAVNAGKSFWCDQTPWNVLIAKRLAHAFPDALFVLMLRHYRGVVASLRRSYLRGYAWAGMHFSDSADLWSRCYAAAAELPETRTIAVSYDALCAHPNAVLDRLTSEVLAGLELEDVTFDRSVFCQSHAEGEDDRKLAVVEGDRVVFRSVPSYDVQRWSDGMESACLARVEATENTLRERYAGLYGLEEFRPAAVK